MSKNTVTIDTDAMYAILSASTRMQAALEDKAKEIANKASAIARVEVYNTGFYSSSFVAGSMSSKELRFLFRGANSTTAARSRGRRRRAAGKFSEAIEGDYKGAVGVVGSRAKTAIFHEYGTYARPGKFVLTRAALESGGSLASGDLKPGTISSNWKRSPKITSRQRRDEQAFRRSMAASGTNLSNRTIRNARKSGKALSPSSFTKTKRRA